MSYESLIISGLLLAGALHACAAGYVKTGNAVDVAVAHPTAESPRWVRLQVMSDKIIRVEATSESAFPLKNSLIIVPEAFRQNPSFKVGETDGEVVVSTSKVQAKVSKATGRVVFYDASGHQLLAEDERQGKTIAPSIVPEREIGVDSRLLPEQKKGYSWRLLFDNQPGEAFYGLGQHQAGELNMKGKNEDLFQYNTKVSVPFVVSNRDYGILWDSYSYCRFGNPNDYLQLNHAFTLYDKEGRRGHLTGIYRAADGATIVRQEDSIYYEFALPDIAARGLTDIGIGNLPKNFKMKGAHVTYEGYIEAPVDNRYRFNLYYAGYTKVYVNGKLVVPEHWRQAWNPNACKFTVDLKKGERTKLCIDWYPDGDVSYCGLRVVTPRSEEEQGRLSIWSEMSRDLDYYFIAGSNLDDVISGYRTLTGKAQIIPKWSLGFWQSRERYRTSKDIEETLVEFRKRHFPVDNIVQDWNYWADDQWGSHQFESWRYPNPQAMLDSVHAMHGRFMISVWPKFYCNTSNYKELDAHGWMYHQAPHDSIRDWVGPGYFNSFYDAYSDGARRMFWRQMNENLYSKYKFGIDAWWKDASEPNVRDCTPMWYLKALCGPTALGSSTEYFSAYSLVNIDAIYNGQRSVNPNQRVFLLTRSGFAGEQRYSTATWSGDIGTRWEDMRAQVTAGLNYSLAGQPFWGMDIGGFSVEDHYVRAQQKYDRTGKENADLKEWRELQARWNELGAFVPLYRTHGQWPLREVWNIAPDTHPAYLSIVYYDRLRYRLMPYLYSMAAAVHFNDYTMMRALVMDFNGDDKVYDIKNQWMFGPSLMACPVMEYKVRKRDVFLPKQCGWYDLYSGRHFNGGTNVTADAPYTRVPVFVPEGSIIPFGPAMEWSDEKPADLITLYVYAGRDGKFTLYEDEGTNYDYERGQYAAIDFRYDDANHTLAIGARKGSFPGMLQQRRFRVVLIDSKHAATLEGVLNDAVTTGKLVEYSGKAISVRL